jgi:hypothetical protein
MYSCDVPFYLGIFSMFNSEYILCLFPMAPKEKAVPKLDTAFKKITKTN